jgi:hypothetical protein
MGLSPTSLQSWFWLLFHYLIMAPLQAGSRQEAAEKPFGFSRL